MHWVKGSTGEKPRIGPQKLNPEAPKEGPNQVEQEQITDTQAMLKTTRYSQQQCNAQSIPQQLVEEQRMKPYATGQVHWGHAETG